MEVDFSEILKDKSKELLVKLKPLYECGLEVKVFWYLCFPNSVHSELDSEKQISSWDMGKSQAKSAL